MSARRGVYRRAECHLFLSADLGVKIFNGARQSARCVTRIIEISLSKLFLGLLSVFQQIVALFEASKLFIRLDPLLKRFPRLRRLVSSQPLIRRFVLFRLVKAGVA
ncbi:hypothetical protein DOFOFD_09740 [Acetobacteraceae bacterium EV16P]|uniref:Uncharacterized protein n=1 Tax=Sorlinia euscelidii TaxID=3081148 RepID=A0ABU7U369_9PROT